MDVKISCVCPGTPHAEDTVTVMDRLDFRGAATIRQLMGGMYREDPDASTSELAGLLVEHYLICGITGWTLVNEKGKRVPVTKPAVRAFLNDHPLEGFIVGDAVDDPYSEQVVLPLLRKASSSSPPTQTETATSPTSGSPRTSKPSKRSSTTSTRTVATEPTPMSRDGGGSTSTSSASAA
jgi:hypothetical protein